MAKGIGSISPLTTRSGQPAPKLTPTSGGSGSKMSPGTTKGPGLQFNAKGVSEKNPGGTGTGNRW